MKAFEATLFDRSSPKSENYGKWLSKEEVANMLPGNPSGVAAVMDFLAVNGVTEGIKTSPGKDVIRVSVPAPKVESML
ncbi:MAG: protease pro-enzyme activation domain-containing protein, partial [Bacteroidota bacterium]